MTTKTNLFGKAKEAAPATAPKKSDYELVIVPELNDGIAELSQIRNLLKEKEGIASVLEEEIKTQARAKYIELYLRDKRNPKSFLIAGSAAAKNKFLIQVQDKYTKVTPEREEALVAEYGEEVLDEKTKYVFNPDLLQKYMQEISDLIMNCKKISAEDKENLILAERTVTIKKGMIDTAATQKDLGKFITNISPIVMLSDRSS
ncbi:MAG TPA: hypothetical protein PLJ00_15760 [Chitinophagales bacterium]|nr:hypothetical protein [Chitinophagales bacterium]